MDATYSERRRMPSSRRGVRATALVLACLACPPVVARAEPVPLLTVTLDGAPGTIGVAPGDPSFGVSGRVALANVAIPAAPVDLLAGEATIASTRAGADGRFTFSGIASSFTQGTEYLLRAAVRIGSLENRSLTLRVRAGVFAVSVAGSGGGRGRIRSPDGRIDCGYDGASTTGACQAMLVTGASLSVDAVGENGDRFDGWRDDEGRCAGIETCSLEVAFTSRGILRARFRDPAASQLALGTRHSCVIDDGAVRCWGWNANGELGRGVVGAADASPRTVGTLASGADEITAGGAHTCVRVGTSVRCWGSNAAGQLGDGTTDARATPVEIALPPVRAVEAGGQHTCAITVSNEVWCWGRNANGQLGDGTEDARTVPTRVGVPAGLEGATLRSLGLGAHHSCVVTRAGAAWCWGRNSEGQLGDGTTISRRSPVRVLGSDGALADVVAITAGARHTCAVTVGGSRCWGRNDDGQLGDGSGFAALRSRADGPGHATGFAQIAAGEDHACGVTGTTVACWGSNGSGQIQIDPQEPLPPPQDPTRWEIPRTTAAPASLEVAAGAGHTCVRDVAGAVRCWGRNAEGVASELTFTAQLGWNCPRRYDVAIRRADGSALGCA